VRGEKNEKEKRECSSRYFVGRAAARKTNDRCKGCVSAANYQLVEDVHFSWLHEGDGKVFETDDLPAASPTPF
jgi:hypothetical protein